ncbi:extracellular sulfatase SULF-1 homolog isoform X2 [Zootermopsis nevadensis]|uniref:extracellular sulfatase SULF-1 homolog isoform X2 n=1 Tax=Zootermopsis nevadensis TaxID=136037 RepID=UPI000B8E7E35|nr:extracellular sulfatase SULF-1 homolog isoform X2 [Zootermopsis nevadensis]
MARDVTPLLVAVAFWFIALGVGSAKRVTHLRHQQQQEDLASTDDVFASQRRGASAAAEYQTQRRGGKLKKHHIPAQPYEIPKERKPNIILILTDDQDVELGSLNFMPRTLRLLRDGGAEFRHAYVTTPMCCPSRSSLLTGMYVHNHEVFTNNDNCSSAHWQATHETRSFATYLSNAGYRTGYFGKYLNKYNGSYIPPGWREWGGLIMNSRYYNYSINLNGKKIKHGADYHKDYYPDLIANDSVAFLRQSKQYFSRKPVMLVLSFPAPHGPEDSAPQFSHLFFNVTTHHTPTYDYAPNPDKQWILQVTQRMQPIHRQFTDLLMTKRLQTLQSVDDAVEKIFQELKELGELDNTYIIYTSDHGYHLGQFGLVKGKSFPFEFDVRVPFLVRGPEIEPGTIIDDIVLNLDLAPTFLDIAGVEIPVHMDGRSFLKLLHRNPKHGQMSARRKKFKWPDTFLIESSGRRETPESIEAKLHLLKPQHQAKLNKIAAGSESEENGNGTGISATLGTTFAPLTSQYPNLSMDESGLNDTSNALHIPVLDPSLEDIPLLSRPDLQLDNQVLPVVPSGVVTNKLERIALECQSPEYQAPCKPGQKWQCITEGSRWRKHKCKFQGTIYPRGGSNGRKKCACFTPSGFFYTRLEPNERRMQRQFLRGHVNKDIKDYRPKFLRTVQAKPSTADFNLTDFLRQASSTVDSATMADLIDRYNSEQVRKANRRGKRDTLEHVTDSIMKDIQKDIEKELHGLQVSQAAEDSNSNISSAENMIQLAGCLVTPTRNVNCSAAVYKDLPTWRTSKNNIDGAIRKLLAQVEALKEIRRHLRQKRPLDTTSYDASLEDADEDGNDGTEELLEEEKEEEKEEEVDVDDKEGIENSNITNIRKVQHNQEIGVETVTETKNIEEEMRHFENQTKHSQDQHNRNDHKGNHHRGKKKAKEHATVTVSTEENVTQNTPGEKKFDETLFDEYDTEGSQVSTLVTTEHSRFHHRHHHFSPTSRPDISHPTNLTTDQSVNVDSAIEVTLGYLDLNIHEGPTTESSVMLNLTSKPISQHRVKLPKPTANNENKLGGLGPSRIDVTVYHPQRPGYGIQNVNNINSSTSSGNSNKQIFLPEGQGQHTCYCEPDILSRHEEKEIAKEARRRIKEERLKKKERKLKKKAKLEKECLAEKMNCFNHDNDHWKTAPLWTEGPFCFCMNANNNTYSCLRTINATHNFLYCEFVTGLVTFYNLRIDPFEQWNRVHALTDGERSYLRDQLAQLKACRGTKQCTVGIAASSADQIHINSNTAPISNMENTASISSVGGIRYKKRKYSSSNAGLYSPSSAMHLVSQSHLLPPTNKKRKKLPKPWRRRKAWPNQWRQRRRRFRQYFQQQYQQQ